MGKSKKSMNVTCLRYKIPCGGAVWIEPLKGAPGGFGGVCVCVLVSVLVGAFLLEFVLPFSLRVELSIG